MKDKIITKSFERLLAKGLHRGFITYEELGKSLGKRGKSTDNLEKAVIIIFDNKISLVSKKSDYQPVKKKDTSQGDSEKSTEKSDDPIRMYLREMGGVELLSREGEIAGHLATHLQTFQCLHQTFQWQYQRRLQLLQYRYQYGPCFSALALDGNTDATGMHQPHTTTANWSLPSTTAAAALLPHLRPRVLNPSAKYTTIHPLNCRAALASKANVPSTFVIRLVEPGERRSVQQTNE